MKRRSVIGKVGAVSVSLLAGCLGGESDDTSEEEVLMEDDSFQPIQISIDPGMRIKWVNNDSSVHTVTAAQFHEEASEWSIDEPVGQDESFSHQFDETGIYEYRDKFVGEDSMCGAVLVGDVSLDASLPCK